MTSARPTLSPPSRPGVARVVVGLTGLFASVTLLALMAIALAPGFLPGWGSTVVASASMTPALRPGDVVAFRQIEASTVGTGTIIVFDDPDRPGSVVHRVVDVAPDGLVTHGDASPVRDSRVVTAADVKGAAFLVVPWAGLPRLWWDEGRWYLTALTMGVALACALSARRILMPFEPPWESRPAAARWLHEMLPAVDIRLIPNGAHRRILARSRDLP
jgi:signal peptidase I